MGIGENKKHRARTIFMKREHSKMGIGEKKKQRARTKVQAG